MGKTSYKNTAELIAELSSKIDELNNGSLDLTELDSLVDCGKDLYEQLIILRYKAFDKLGTPETNREKEMEPVVINTTKPVVNEPKEEEETMFDFTNLDTVVEESQPSFDFTIEEEKTEEEETIEPEVEKESIVEKIEVQEQELVQEEEQQEQKHELEGEQDEDVSESLHESLKNQDDQSLRKKLQNTPISNLKSHISIAKKFEYISQMFDGDKTAYDEAIDFLNTAASGKDAQLKLNELTTIYKWDLEDKSIIKFIELVERRYL